MPLLPTLLSSSHLFVDFSSRPSTDSRSPGGTVTASFGAGAACEQTQPAQSTGGGEGTDVLGEGQLSRAVDLNLVVVVPARACQQGRSACCR